jgi:hypothetical protein
LQDRDGQASQEARTARERAEASAAVLAGDAAKIRDGLLAAWDTHRPDASVAARVVQQGPGRFGRHRGGGPARGDDQP